MTKEEAKQIISDIDHAWRSFSQAEYVALEMAIEALEQEPKFIAKSDGTIEQIKNCNNCKYGYLSSICQKPNTEICGNSFSQWKPYKAESDDCISRAEAQKRISIGLYESALNTVDYDCKTSDVFKDIAEKLSTCISEIPSIQPKPKTGQWIPVSERLPETSGEYFITIDCGDGFLCTEFSWFYIDNKVWSYRNAKILAWMPLPECYREETE